MNRIATIGLAVLGVCALPMASMAADEKMLSDEAELSLVNVSGNTHVTTASLKNLLKYKPVQPATISWKLGVLYGESEVKGVDTMSAQQSFTDLRLDYVLDDRMYAYGNLGWFHDKLAKIENRYTLGAGAGYKFLVGPSNFLSTEAGLVFSSDHYYGPASDDYLAGRVFGQYAYVFSGKNKFTQSVEYLQSFDMMKRFFLNSETAVTAALNDNFALKCSYLIKYANHPVDGASDTDRTLALSLVATY